MINPDLIRTEPDLVARGAKAKGVTVDLSALRELDEQRRALKMQIDELRARRNQLSVEQAKNEGPAIKTELKTLEERLNQIEGEYQTVLLAIPNLPSPDVPIAPDASGNVVIRAIGDKPNFAFPAKDHIELGETLGILDFERAAKVSGSRFVYRLGDLVLVEFALIHYAYDTLGKHEFQPILPPVLIRPEPFWGMARLDRDQTEERYHLPHDNLYLVGSAEHTIGPIHAGEVFDDADLPRRYLGFSSCFRREAGSYGKDVRGILRMHQFDKVEMFSFVRPEESDAELERLVGFQEELMQGLCLPYQVVQIASGDMGWPDAKQYDIETWLPGQGQYRETHSASNTTDYQARRLNIRVRSKGKGTELVHMLNATGLALSRIVIAILENYQQADGSIEVPEVLRPYTGFDSIIQRTPRGRSA